MKNIIIALGAIIVIGGAFYYFLSKGSTVSVEKTSTNDKTEITDTSNTDSEIGETLKVEKAETKVAPVETIGTSVNGTAIKAYHFGNGAKEVLFVGGIHSAFAPNTVTIAEKLIEALKTNTIVVPQGITVTIIPDLNPDATGKPNTLSARLNEHGVDLNRNFDCEWSAEGTWRTTAVSGGKSAFSEPETKAIKDYINTHDVAGAVVYYAADGGVYASNCGGALDDKVKTLTNIYADASGYTANKEFDAYAISGDMTNWLARKNIPAIGVLMTDYTNVEWDKNKAGVEAILNFYKK